MSPSLGKATAAARAALPTANSACGISVCPNKGMGCQCSGSLTCAEMLIHAIAHGGYTGTVRESALKVDPGRKIPSCTGESNLPQCLDTLPAELHPRPDFLSLDDRCTP